MKYFIILSLLFLTSCASGVGVTSVTLPEVQSIEYKDIIACVKVPEAPEYSDCKIKVGDSGATVTLRIQTKEIPKPPVE